MKYSILCVPRQFFDGDLKSVSSLDLERETEAPMLSPPSEEIEEAGECAMLESVYVLFNNLNLRRLILFSLPS